MADATAPPNIIVPGPFATYGTVTLNAGGSMQLYVATSVTITTLTKNT